MKAAVKGSSCGRLLLDYIEKRGDNDPLWSMYAAD
jgi:hypothetical protein